MGISDRDYDRATTMDAAQSQLTTFASTFFSHMLHSHAESVQQSLLNAFDAYITWASGTDAKFSGSDMDVDQIGKVTHKPIPISSCRILTDLYR